MTYTEKILDEEVKVLDEELKALDRAFTAFKHDAFDIKKEEKSITKLEKIFKHIKSSIIELNDEFFGVIGNKREDRETVEKYIKKFKDVFMKHSYAWGILNKYDDYFADKLQREKEERAFFQLINKHLKDSQNRLENISEGLFGNRLKNVFQADEKELIKDFCDRHHVTLK